MWAQTKAGSRCLCSSQFHGLSFQLLRRSAGPAWFSSTAMALESWRLSRAELRDLLLKYEKAVEEDAFNLLQPKPAERALLGDATIRRRAEAVRKARDQNRRFIEAVVEDLPDLCAGPEAANPPLRPVAQFRNLENGVSTLPSSSYGTMASVFLHLMRDWSGLCEHVGTSTYGPTVAELKALLPKGGEVLLPGAGLGRLAVSLAAEGYKVEANDASRLFLTFADYILNRPPTPATSLFPLAHVFTENWSHDQQYVEIQVPSPLPVEVSGNSIVLMPGDFAKTYQSGGPGHRRFDAIVTCFFVDTMVDIVELFEVLDGLLVEGGVWVNIGPLNWRKEARMKLCWDEIKAIWEAHGYEFVTNKRADVDYHMPRLKKMYTESYNVSLTAAVKRKSTGK